MNYQRLFRFLMFGALVALASPVQGDEDERQPLPARALPSPADGAKRAVRAEAAGGGPASAEPAAEQPTAVNSAAVKPPAVSAVEREYHHALARPRGEAGAYQAALHTRRVPQSPFTAGATVQTKRLQAAPLTPALRNRGFHECYPHDPLGLGPYATFRNLRLGRIAIPQKGGHTPDLGYDVVIHLHGQSAVRKTLVQVARGVAFVGIDLGLGSGAYSKAFKDPQFFPKLRRSVEAALKRHTGDSRAHIRHLGLSAWSAGYGAVNQILKRHADTVDAVVLLDGLHAAWSWTRRQYDQSTNALSARTVIPTFKFARRALAGDKIFVFTHSEIDPIAYPSTARTADLLLAHLGESRRPVVGGSEPYAQFGAVDVRGLHLWSYRGRTKLAHCAHIPVIARAVRGILEEEWNTPAMDRSVPPTPAPKLGPAKPRTARLI